ncbi:MAG: methyl-accepting chemotaxis protein [Bacteroidetes bacterium]|nr:methyl-accepting chemotaxis protein [Bacteroidota bacterium]
MKLQTKILIPVLAFIILLTISLSIIYYYVIGGTAEKQFIKRGVSVGTNLATAGRFGVLMSDASQLAQHMDAALADPEIVYVGFFDANGAEIASRGTQLKNRGVQQTLITEPLHGKATLSNGNEAMEFVVPVYSRQGDTKSIGVVRVGISTDKFNADIRSALIWSIVLCIVFSLTAVFAVQWIMKIVSPLIEGIRLVSTGDLSIELQKKTNDEVGELIEELRNFVIDLRTSIKEIKDETQNVSYHAEAILKDSQTIAANAENGSHRVSEVATAIQEMAATISENSQNAVRTSETSEKARKAALQGGTIVEETVESMKSIAAVVRKSSQTIQELGKSSNQIGEIISVIDDIADQTNLLALNAAIEAARAGEQGRGFAVVADEVRKLAERTTKATKEIAAMIKKIQVDTQGAVKAMEEGTMKVDEGIQRADKAGSALNEIVQLSQEVTTMISQIVAASTQQASTSEQISHNVEILNSVTEQTAKGIQQIAQAAEELNKFTDRLYQLLEKFKLEQLDDSSTQPQRIAKSRYVVRENGRIVHHN